MNSAGVWFCCCFFLDIYIYILYYLFDLVSLHRVVFIVAIFSGIRFQCQFFGLDCYVVI